MKWTKEDYEQAINRRKRELKKEINIEYLCKKERFLNDVKDHKFSILKEDGLYRHIRLKRPESSTYRFDILTWPGYLCITGDMGCLTFSRVEDMVEFFGMDDNDFNKKHVINPSYWEEKIQSISKFGGPSKEFDNDTFRENVIQRISDYYEDDEEKKKECLEEIQDQVFYYMEDEHPQSIYQKLYEFNFKNFSFDESPNGEIYTFHYIWILYAIVYGITEYKKFKNIV